MKKVKDVMVKKVFTLRPDDTIMDAIKLFSEKEITGAPVVRDRKAIGVVSDTDIVKMINIYGEIHLSSESVFGLVLSVLKTKDEFRGIRKGLEETTKIKVEDVMSEKLVTVNQDDRLVKAIRMIDEHDVTRLPVVDDEGNLVGILCRGDIIKALA